MHGIWSNDTGPWAVHICTHTHTLKHIDMHRLQSRGKPGGGWVQWCASHACMYQVMCASGTSNWVGPCMLLLCPTRAVHHHHAPPPGPSQLSGATAEKQEGPHQLLVCLLGGVICVCVHPCRPLPLPLPCCCLCVMCACARAPHLHVAACMRHTRCACGCVRMMSGGDASRGPRGREC